MQVYLFRHSQTASNATRKYLGITDESLCPAGIETAEAAGKDYDVQEVLVTPLKRTQMTASILFPNARQRVCHGLREMDFGDFEGRSAEEMKDDADYRCWVEQTRCMGPCPHGDATLVFQHRVIDTFLHEVKKALLEGRERLYFVVHGGVIMTVLYRFARPSAPFYAWPLGNCQGYRCNITMCTEGIRLTEVTHLEKVIR